MKRRLISVFIMSLLVVSGFLGAAPASAKSKAPKQDKSAERAARKNCDEVTRSIKAQGRDYLMLYRQTRDPHFAEQARQKAREALIHHIGCRIRY